MRTLSIAFTVFLYTQLAFGYTFIFQNGKKVEGTVLFEDGSSYRILEKSGLNMTLKKSQLNFAAMQKANRKIESVETSAPEPSVSASASTRRVVRSFTNRNVPAVQSVGVMSVEQAQQEFSRLSAACRAAGTGPSMKKVLRTDHYNVHGKTVAVTGYWAHPSNIKEAKQICDRALEAQAILRKKSANTVERAPAPSSPSTAGGYR